MTVSNDLALNMKNHSTIAINATLAINLRFSVTISSYRPRTREFEEKKTPNGLDRYDQNLFKQNPPKEMLMKKKQQVIILSHDNHKKNPIANIFGHLSSIPNKPERPC